MLNRYQLRTLSLLRQQPYRQFSFDYSAIEESPVKIQQDQVALDNLLFEIVQKCTTLPDLVRFYQNAQVDLPNLHHSILLNKLSTYSKQERAVENKTDQMQHALVDASKIANICVTHLFDNLQKLDPQSLMHTLNVLAFRADSIKLNFNTSEVRMQQVETKILSNIYEFLNNDIANALVCLMRLKYYPATVLESLNEMQKMTIVKKDDTLRLLDTLVRFEGRQEQYDAMNSELVDKLLD